MQASETETETEMEMEMEMEIGNGIGNWKWSSNIHATSMSIFGNTTCIEYSQVASSSGPSTQLTSY